MKNLFKQSLLTIFLLLFTQNYAFGVNLTFDNFVDPNNNLGTITATKTDSGDTYILTAQHGDNSIVDVTTVGGKLLFYNGSSVLSPDHWTISLEKNGVASTFTLGSIFYDTTKTGTIGITNQDGDTISSNTSYNANTSGSLSI